MTTPGGTIGAPAFPDVVAFDVDGDSVAAESVQVLVGEGGGGIYQEVTLAGGSLVDNIEVFGDAGSVLVNDAGLVGGMRALLVSWPHSPLFVRLHRRPADHRRPASGRRPHRGG